MVGFFYLNAKNHQKRAKKVGLRVIVELIPYTPCE